MTLNTDFHSHVSRSSAREMALAAQARGLRVLGLSEHIFQMSEARSTLSHLPQEGPLLSMSTYIEAVQTEVGISRVRIWKQRAAEEYRL